MGRRGAAGINAAPEPGSGAGHEVVLGEQSGLSGFSQTGMLIVRGVAELDGLSAGIEDKKSRLWVAAARLSDTAGV